MKNEVKAVWLPYTEMGRMLAGRDASGFADEFQRRMELAAEFGINRVFAHVRPFADALYVSDLFPSSHLISGIEGEAMSFDPLEIMLSKAHALGIELEAWINPFRIRAPGVAKAEAGLCGENPALHMKDSEAVIEYRGGLAYNPASMEAQELIIGGLEEICRRYPVDGIHFDDYFYPTQDPYFDLSSFQAYKLPGGGLSQATWRRQNVSLFLKRCYKAVHESGAKRFGLSPKGFMDCNLNEEFLDVPRVLSQNGYIDYVCPQAYFAMTDEISPFPQVMQEYDQLIKADIELLAGLAVYKLGWADVHAGEQGLEEWLNGKGVLASMADCAAQTRHGVGYSLYDLRSAFLPEPAKAGRIKYEMDALRKVK